MEKENVSIDRQAGTITVKPTPSIEDGKVSCSGCALREWEFLHCQLELSEDYGYISSAFPGVDCPAYDDRCAIQSEEAKIAREEEERAEQRRRKEFLESRVKA